MKKTLVYHIYLCDDIDTNKAYRINLECLKYFIHIFDKVIFVNVMNDLSDMALRKKGIDFITEIGYKGDTDIVFRKNTDIGEAATVRDFVFNDYGGIDNDSAVFFGHTKGVGNFKKNEDNDANRFSMFMWILVLYFYNFNFINEMEDNFMGRDTHIKLFHGALLMNYKKRIVPSIPKFHYSGSFYWLNKPFFKKMGGIKEYPFSSRYDAEFLPGFYGADDVQGTLFGTHNGQRLVLDEALGAFYSMSQNMWYDLLGIIGDKENFLDFKTKIENIVGEI